MDNVEITREPPANASNAQPSGQLLTIMRFSLLPAVAMSVVSLPVLMLASVMITDAGTEEAVRLSLMVLLVLGSYSAAAPAAFIKWMQWPRFSPMLLLFYAVGSLAAIALAPSIPATFPLYLIATVTQIDINELPMSLGVVIFAVFCVAIPALAAVSLLRATRSETTSSPATSTFRN